MKKEPSKKYLYIKTFARPRRSIADFQPVTFIVELVTFDCGFEISITYEYRIKFLLQM